MDGAQTLKDCPNITKANMRAMYRIFSGKDTIKSGGWCFKFVKKAVLAFF
jgi:hypothetical protein